MVPQEAPLTLRRPHNNVGANCHTLQVAAGNLRPAEEQVGSGHKQRWRGGRHGGQDASQQPQSCSVCTQPQTHCYYQLNCPNNYTSHLSGRREPVQSVLRWRSSAALILFNQFLSIQLCIQRVIMYYTNWIVVFDCWISVLHRYLCLIYIFNISHIHFFCFNEVLM